MYLNPNYTEESVKRLVIDQWHLWLALNPAGPTAYTVAEKPCKDEPLRVRVAQSLLHRLDVDTKRDEQRAVSVA